MNLKDIKNISLPKWPQMLVTGETITNQDNILDILMRTDTFFTDISEYSGGNNREYNKWYRNISGINKYLTGSNADDWKTQWKIQDKLRKDLGVISNEYVHNSWASCSFIGGGHGWCSPEGVIEYIDNVGKWPSSEEIYNEWKHLAKAFPYINLNVTILNGESCEDNKVPLFNLKVNSGKVKVLPPNITVHKGADKKQREFALGNFWDNRKENCVPTNMVLKIADKVSRVLDKIEDEQ